MISPLPQVFIDGPFGAPTSQIFRAQHAVLIGTGIGVTPFASILQSIMHRYWQERNECPRCKYNWTNDLSSSSVLNLRKVDFFWINRDQVRATSTSPKRDIIIISRKEDPTLQRIAKCRRGGGMETSCLDVP